MIGALSACPKYLVWIICLELVVETVSELMSDGLVSEPKNIGALRELLDWKRKTTSRDYRAAITGLACLITAQKNAFWLQFFSTSV